MLFSQRVFQNTSLPQKNARLTPASRAASTLARWLPDQYSSWPTDRKTSCSSSSAPRRSVSTPVRVADVVAVGLQPAHHRVLGVEDAILGRVAARGERPVVAHLVGAAGGRAGVEAVAAVGVVGLPGGVRGLEQQVGARRRRRGRRRTRGSRRRCRRCERAWRSRCRTQRRSARTTRRSGTSCRNRRDRSRSVRQFGWS